MADLSKFLSRKYKSFCVLITCDYVYEIKGVLSPHQFHDREIPLTLAEYRKYETGKGPFNKIIVLQEAILNRYISFKHGVEIIDLKDKEIKKFLVV